MDSAVQPTEPILVIDDEEPILYSVSTALSISGMTNVATCQDSREVKKLLRSQAFSVITLDLNMPYISGEDLLPHILEEYPEIPVIVVTGALQVETAVYCMKAGAFDYLVKPVDKSRLVTSIRHAIEHRQIVNENSLLRERMLSGSHEMKSSSMLETLSLKEGAWLTAR